MSSECKTLWLNSLLEELQSLPYIYSLIVPIRAYRRPVRCQRTCRRLRLSSTPSLFFCDFLSYSELLLLGNVKYRILSNLYGTDTIVSIHAILLYGNVHDKRTVNTSERLTFCCAHVFSLSYLILPQQTMSSLSYESRLNLALEAIQNNKKLSKLAIAKAYSVLYTTLCLRHAGRPARCNILANSRKLTDLEEETIVQYITKLCTRSFPPRLSGMEDMAN
jgi:hypothetical protein